MSNNDGDSGASQQLQLPPSAGVSRGQSCWPVRADRRLPHYRQVGHKCFTILLMCQRSRYCWYWVSEENDFLFAAGSAERRAVSFSLQLKSTFLVWVKPSWWVFCMSLIHKDILNVLFLYSSIIPNTAFVSCCFKAHINSPNAELSQAALQALGFCVYHSHVVSAVPGTQLYTLYTSLFQRWCGGITWYGYEIAAESDAFLLVFQKPLQQKYCQHFAPWWWNRQIRIHAPEHYGSSPNRVFLQMWLPKK